jgi:hypothetical protein
MNCAVDVLVPVHSASRPIARLVESVLRWNRLAVRIIFIAHNISVAEIASALGDWAADERVEIVPFSDGVVSPAGPLRYGLLRVKAPFFCKIDSDDYLAPGALDSWSAVQRASGADIVMASMRVAGSLRNYPTPPTRPMRRNFLDPVKDRLAYRSNTMGLIRTSYAQLAAPSTGLVTGEDILPSLRLWFSGAHIVASSPEFCYLVGDDASDRVTAQLHPVGQELAFVPGVLNDLALLALDSVSRASIVTKLLRVQIFGAVERRSGHEWTDTELQELASLTESLVAFAPQSKAVLSRSDAALLRVIVAKSPNTTEMRSGILRSLGESRHHYERAGALVPNDFTKLLHRDAPLRFLAASVIARHRVR